MVSTIPCEADTTTGRPTACASRSAVIPAGKSTSINGTTTTAALRYRSRSVPLGTLRRAASYPQAADTVDDKALRAALETVGLGHVVDRIDEDGVAWDQVLSGGEKRRLSVATVLAAHPQVLVLDEPTFGQDANTWAELASFLSELLDQGTAVVSVTHDEEFSAVLGGMELRLDPATEAARQEAGAA